MECSICMRENLRSPVVTCCGHLFCWPCIFAWLDRQRRKNIGQVGSCPVCKGALNLQAGQIDFTPIYMAGSQDTEDQEEYKDCIPPRPSAARRDPKAEQMLQSHEHMDDTHILQSHEHLDDTHIPEVTGQLALLFPLERISEPDLQAAHNLHTEELSQEHPTQYATNEQVPLFSSETAYVYQHEDLQVHPEDMPRLALLIPAEIISESVHIQAAQNSLIPDVSQEVASNHYPYWNASEVDFTPQLAQGAGHALESQSVGRTADYSAYLHASTNYAEDMTQLAAQDGTQESQSYLQNAGTGNIVYGIFPLNNAPPAEAISRDAPINESYQYIVGGTVELPLQHGSSGVIHPVNAYQNPPLYLYPLQQYTALAAPYLIHPLNAYQHPPPYLHPQSDIHQPPLVH